MGSREGCGKLQHAHIFSSDLIQTFKVSWETICRLDIDHAGHYKIPGENQKGPELLLGEHSDSTVSDLSPRTPVYVRIKIEANTFNYHSGQRLLET